MRKRIWIMLVSMAVLVLLGSVGPVATANGGVVHEVYPTGDPTQDVPNIQQAIDNAADGDTILLKAGTFDFGDWRTNPIPGGLIVINKGVTVTGDGFDANGDPRTIIQGGGYRQKNHWEHGEWGVVTFAGNARGGVLEGVWLKEPHFYGVFASGFWGQNHENITIRNVKITDISQDIPSWDQLISLGRSIDMGANLPEFGLGGPSGTLTIEGCEISSMGSSVDLDYIDPDNGTPYYRQPDGEGALADGSQSIGLWISSAVSYVIRNNELWTQNEGIVIEAVGGSGSMLITDNEITVQPVAPGRHWVHGFRLEPPYPGMVVPPPDTLPYTRVVRFTNNHIRVLAEPQEGGVSAGLLLGSDNGVDAYSGHIFVEGNEIEMQGGDAALVLGLDRGSTWVSVLNGAVIRNNHIRGTARYGILSVVGAQYCTIFGNNLATFEPSVAHIGFYMSATHDNTVRGYSGVVDVADGAYNNYITGYTPMSPHAATR